MFFMECSNPSPFPMTNRLSKTDNSFDNPSVGGGTLLPPPPTANNTSQLTLEPYEPVSNNANSRRGRSNRARNSRRQAISTTAAATASTIMDQLFNSNSNQNNFKKYYIIEALSQENLWQNIDTKI